MTNTHIEQWIEERREQFVEDIIELVNIESVSIPTDDPQASPFGVGCRIVLDAAMLLCQRCGFSPINHEYYCLSFLWEGGRDLEVGVFGHLDVVPAGTGWKYQPFEATYTDGIIIGRGSADNKGSTMAALYALLYLKESGYQPLNSIRMVLGCNEELGMRDVEYYAENHKLPELSFTPDANFPVCHAEKGILNLDIKYELTGDLLMEICAGVARNAVPADAYALLRINYEEAKEHLPTELIEAQGDVTKISYSGIASHSAMPEGSKSALVGLAQVLLDSELFVDDEARLLQAITTIFADYYGEGLQIPFSDDVSGKLTHVGSMAQTEAGVCTISINIRYPIATDREQMMKNISDVLTFHGFTIADVTDSPSNYVPLDDDMVTTLTEIANRHLKTQLRPYAMGGGTYARKLPNAVGFGPGNPTRPKRFGEDRGSAHQADEYVEVKTLEQAIKIYVEAIVALDKILDKKYRNGTLVQQK